jgi:hypothetical protein
MIAVAAVCDDRPKREPVSPCMDRQASADLQFRPERRVVLAFGEVPRQRPEYRVHREQVRWSARTVVTMTALSALPYRPSHCRSTCAVFTRSFRSPLSSIAGTLPPCGAVAGSTSGRRVRLRFARRRPQAFEITAATVRLQALPSD